MEAESLFGRSERHAMQTATCLQGRQQGHPNCRIIRHALAHGRNILQTTLFLTLIIRELRGERSAYRALTFDTAQQLKNPQGSLIG